MHPWEGELSPQVLLYLFGPALLSSNLVVDACVLFTKKGIEIMR